MFDPIVLKVVFIIGYALWCAGISLLVLAHTQYDDPESVVTVARFGTMLSALGGSLVLFYGIVGWL